MEASVRYLEGPYITLYPYKRESDYFNPPEMESDLHKLCSRFLVSQISDVAYRLFMLSLRRTSASSFPILQNGDREFGVKGKGISQKTGQPRFTSLACLHLQYMPRPWTRQTIDTLSEETRKATIRLQTTNSPGKITFSANSRNADNIPYTRTSQSCIHLSSFLYDIQE